jgi:hypothetical protein
MKSLKELIEICESLFSPDSLLEESTDFYKRFYEAMLIVNDRDTSYQLAISEVDLGDEEEVREFINNYNRRKNKAGMLDD